MPPASVESGNRFQTLTKRLVIGVSGVALAAAAGHVGHDSDPAQRVLALSAGDVHLLALDEQPPEFTAGECTFRLPGAALLQGCKVEVIPPKPYDDREELEKAPRPLPPKPPVITYKRGTTAKKTSLPPPKPVVIPPSHSKTPPTDENFDRLAQCESGGNWALNTGNGYTGGIQFSGPTWRGVGGTGEAYQHTRREQIDRGKKLQAQSGWRHNWPACSDELELQD